MFQVTGHKNMMSLNTYDELSTDRMKRMSGILSGDAYKAASTNRPNTDASSLLSGCNIHGGTFNISINTCQSSTLSPTWSLHTNAQPAKGKRAVIDSDDDGD